MPEPVKLSRERWEMLKARTGSEPHNRPTKIITYQVEEIDGIVFLPAEYVPYEPPCTCLTIPMVRA